MTKNIEGANNASEAAADYDAELDKKVDELFRMREEYQGIIKRYPKHVRFLLHPPTWLELEDWYNFFGLLMLALELIDFSNRIGLVFVSEFVGATLEVLRIERWKHQILASKQRSIICRQIEDGLLRERRPEHELTISAPLLAKDYFEDASQRDELINRYHLFNQVELQAEAFRAQLLDLGRIEQQRKHYERRRDQALKSLYLVRKEEAQRLQKATKSFEDRQGSTTPNVSAITPLETEPNVDAKADRGE